MFKAYDDETKELNMIVYIDDNSDCVVFEMIGLPADENQTIDMEELDELIDKLQIMRQDMLTLGRFS